MMMMMMMDGWTDGWTDGWMKKKKKRRKQRKKKRVKWMLAGQGSMTVFDSNGSVPGSRLPLGPPRVAEPVRPLTSGKDVFGTTKFSEKRTNKQTKQKQKNY